MREYDQVYAEDGPSGGLPFCFYLNKLSYNLLFNLSLAKTITEGISYIVYDTKDLNFYKTYHVILYLVLTDRLLSTLYSKLSYVYFLNKFILFYSTNFFFQCVFIILITEGIIFIPGWRKG